MLYTIQTKDSNITSYLFGTLHLWDKRAYAFYDIAIDKMKQCHSYYGETDLSQMDVERVTESFLLKEHLDVILGPKKYQKCRKALKEAFGLDLDQCKHYKPMYIQTLFTGFVVSKDYDNNLDQALYIKALEFNMRIDGLESPEEQYAIAQALDMETQLKLFLKMCSNTSKFRHEVNMMCKLYEANEVNKIYKKGLKPLGKMKHTILFDRNVKMTEKISEHFYKGASFYSCGAAHLAGNGGIIAGLKRKGFILKNIIY